MRIAPARANEPDSATSAIPDATSVRRRIRVALRPPPVVSSFDPRPRSRARPRAARTRKAIVQKRGNTQKTAAARAMRAVARERRCVVAHDEALGPDDGKKGDAEPTQELHDLRESVHSRSPWLHSAPPLDALRFRSAAPTIDSQASAITSAR